MIFNVLHGLIDTLCLYGLTADEIRTVEEKVATPGDVWYNEDMEVMR